MPPFDPRTEPFRLSPTLAALTVAVCAAGMTMATRAEPAPAKTKAAATSTKAAKAETSKLGAKAEPTTKAAAAKLAKAASDKTETMAEAKNASSKTAKAKGGAVKGAGSETAKSKTAKSKTAKSKTAKSETAKSETAKSETATGAKQAETKTAKTEASKSEASKTKVKDVKTAKAAAQAAKAPTYAAAQTIKVKLRKGESLEAAIRRAEAAPDEAKTAAAKVETALGKAASAGQFFALEVAPRQGRVGAGRIMGLTLKSASSEPVVLKRGKAGELALASAPKVQLAEAGKLEVDAETDDGRKVRAKLITGEVRGSLYGSARKAGIGGGQIGEIVKVFAAKLDFQRDLKAGDKFTVVYDDDGKLLYAKIKSKGSYRFARSGGEVLWLDDDGKSLKSGLLRTPVDGARMSSRFGLRVHPILGYAKMHQGIDFAAATGTPIMAAGDGEVVEVRRWGGYGNWLRIKHSGGFESGYAHLSRYAAGLKVGDTVKQGELVAYVGSTGASTGAHLHHEIWLNGKRIDPKGAHIPTGFALEGKELVAFKAQQAKVEAALGAGRTQMAGGKSRTKVAGLRPARDNEA